MDCMATININVDENVKSQANELFKSLGLDMTTALNLFLRQAISYGGIPFEIRKTRSYIVNSEEELLTKLSAAEKQIEDGTELVTHEKFWETLKQKYGIEL